MKNRKPSEREVDREVKRYSRDMSRFAPAALTATLMTHENEDDAINKAFLIAEKCSKRIRIRRKRKKTVDKRGDGG